MAGLADNGARGEMAETVRVAADKLSRDLSRTAREAQAAAAEFASKVQYSTGELGERTRELGERAIRRMRNATDDVRENMREHPVAWIAAAAGAAAVIGLLLARRR